MHSYILRTLLVIFAVGVAAAGSEIAAQTREVQNAKEAVNRVLEDSGKHFREGLTALKANRRQDSGQSFDKSVEVFISSAINIQTDGRLQTCYNQLLETVYRIEFPTAARQPQIRSLAASCGWQWNEVDLGLADEVTSLVAQTKPSETPAAQAQAPSDELVGFNSQEFEPSPLDELSKLELLPEELEIEGNPEASQQYQYIQYAVSNRSLGFSFQVHPMIQQYINYYRGRGRRTMEVGLYRSGMFMTM
ncbi:MAG TPA: hypothetical protein PKE66_17590, partial [Pyrinomonadaceae bacterium]|nr:hypothetical protein [Pyrinomonadaceae bacterium]